MVKLDPRRTPMNERVAAEHLSDVADTCRRVTGTPAWVTVSVADLRRRPDGPRDRQLLLGDAVTIYETHQGWCFVQSQKDSYVGYISDTELSTNLTEATHWISAPASHAYAEADFKSRDRIALSFGSRIEVRSQTDRFAETSYGHIPLPHIQKLNTTASDVVSVAETFLGTPYLWGGNSRWGIDCSGLVQTGYLACGLPCPGDSDQQEAELGEPCPNAREYRRGDLLFWKGHVAIVVDGARLIHANAYHMAVAYEGITEAIARILEQGDGPVTAHLRPPL